MTMFPGEAQAKPGSPSYRLSRLLEELNKRFPGVANPVLSDPPEPKLLAAIDSMQTELDNWEKSQELPEWDGDSPEQDWANTPPAVAFHLVEKYAENWTHAGQLMQAYLDAHTAPLNAELAALRHDLERYIAIAGEEATRAEGLRTSLEEMVDRHVNGIAGISPPCIARATALLRCEYCDGTGDVHGIDGEWRGECTACKPGVAGVGDYPGLEVKPKSAVEHLTDIAQDMAYSNEYIGSVFRTISRNPGVERMTGCSCATCRPVTMFDMRMVVCETCGNKRCPRATDHRNECSGSNEPGQEGSSYAGCSVAPAKESK